MPLIMPMDMLLFALAGGFAVWEGYSLVSTRGKIRVEGKPFGRNAAAAIIAVLSALVLWRQRETLGSIWLHAIVIAVALALYVLLKAGLGDDGIYHNSRFFPFSKLQYYSIERETEKGFSLRFSNGRKDFVLDFPIDQRELAVAYMMKGRVPDLKSLPAERRI